jgi:hypothetical protein
VFNSALMRVATINNIPVESQRVTGSSMRQRLGSVADVISGTASHWLHGSIASRMRFLSDLSADPARTVAFDRSMRWLLAVLLGAFVTSVAIAVVMLRDP